MIGSKNTDLNISWLREVLEEEPQLDIGYQIYFDKGCSKSNRCKSRRI